MTATRATRCRLLVSALAVLVNLLSVAEAGAKEVTASGAFRYDVPIEVPGFRGLEPQLRLTYDSLGGDGWLGRGWSLTGLSDIRRAAPGRGAPHYDQRDIFLLDGVELVPCGSSTNASSPSCRYAVAGTRAFSTLVESFDRIGFAPGPSGGRWTVWDKDGARRIYAPARGSGGKVARWHLSRVIDTLGNTVRFTYHRPPATEGRGDEYLRRIRYGSASINFRLGRRPDPLRQADGRDELLVSAHRLRLIVVRFGGAPVRAYRFRYRAMGGRSTLAGVKQFGRDVTIAKGRITGGRSLPAVRLTTGPDGEVGGWESTDPFRFVGGPPAFSSTPKQLFNHFSVPELVINNDSGYQVGDVDGDGKSDAMVARPDRQKDPQQVVFVTTTTNAYGVPSPHLSVAPWPSPDKPMGDIEYPFTSAVTDLNGDGRSDFILTSLWRTQPGSTGQHVGFIAALSKGDGQFEFLRDHIEMTDWLSYAAPQQYARIRCVTGDVDADGRGELICSREEPQTGKHLLSVVSMRDDGTFARTDTSLPFPAGGATQTPYAGEANVDGMADILMLTSYFACSINQLPLCGRERVLVATSLGPNDKGAVHFDVKTRVTPWRQPSVADQAWHFQFGDIDGDRRSDLVWLTGTSSSQLTTLRTALIRRAKLVTTTQTLPVPLPTYPETDARLVLGDVNGDSRADLMLATIHAPHSATACAGAFTFFHVRSTRVLSNGDGTFQLPLAPWDDCSVSHDLDLEGVYFSNETRPADTNGDGMADELVVNGEVLDDPSPTTGLDTHRWLPAEVTGDGRSDLVYVQTRATGPQVHTLVRTPDGAYEQRVQDLEQFDIPSTWRPVNRNWKLMDTDGDGREDLVYVLAHQRFGPQGVGVLTFRAVGDGKWGRGTFDNPGPRFGAANAGIVDEDAHRWEAMEVNGDARSDLVRVDAQPGGVRVRVLLAEPGGAWTPIPHDVPVPDLPVADRARWRAMDVNGDGRVDLVHLWQTATTLHTRVLLADGQGNWTVQPDDVEVGTGAYGSETWRSGDVNGDGDVDLLHLATSPAKATITTLLATGSGGFTALKPESVPLPDADLDDSVGWVVADATADGRTDLVYALANEGGGATVYTLVAGGTGFALHKAPVNAWPGQTAGDPARWHTADVDGDGDGDLVRVDPTGPAGSRLAVSTLLSQAPRDLVTDVHTPMGGHVSVGYSSSSRHAARDDSPRGCHLPAGVVLPTVESVRERDGRHAELGATTYGYSCARWSYRHRTFLGWTDVFEHTSGRSSRPATNTLRRYEADDTCMSRPQSTSVMDVSNRPLIREFTDYAPQPAPLTCLPSADRRLDFSLRPGADALNIETGYRYDDFGNLITRMGYGDVRTPVDDRTVSVSYKPQTGPWITGLPWQQTLHAGVAPLGALLRSTSSCYDGEAATEFANCAGTPVHGLLTATQRVTDDGSYAVTSYQHDAHGNILLERDARRNGTLWFYDGADHLFPETTCNALQQCEHTTWERGLGLPKDVEDANHEHTGLGYDRFGRLDRVDTPGGGEVVRRYHRWGDPRHQHIHERIADGTADGLTGKTYLDGLGRVYREVREGAAPRTFYVRRTGYADATDQPSRQSDWYLAGQERPRYERFEYDSLGRLVAQTHPDGSERTWSYDVRDGHTTEITSRDETGMPRTTSANAYGRTVRIREGRAGLFFDTSFEYTAADELKSVTDPHGDTATYAWDALGHLVSHYDPDLGTWTFKPDVIGNVRTRTDARGVVTAFTYDPLDRVETKTQPGQGTVTYHYDERNTSLGVGRLTSMSDSTAAGCPDGRSLRLAYGADGRAASETRCVDGRVAQLQTTYDEAGRVKQLTYPDGEQVEHHYDAAGRLKDVGGYVTDMGYDPAGRITSAHYGNGTFASYGYHPRRKWLESITVARGAETIFDDRYTHRPNGQLETSRSSTHQSNLDLTYDAQNRLATVTGDVTQSFTYDEGGNVIAGGGLGQYFYSCPVPRGAQPCPRPHAVRRAGPWLFRLYDANGNLQTMDRGDGSSEQGIDWTPDQQLAVTGDEHGRTQYTYNGNGEQVSRLTPTDETRYFGRWADRSFGTGLVQYYFAGPVLVARKRAGEKEWYVADRRGSTRLLTAESGAVRDRYDYTPFGEVFNVTETRANDIRFAGQRTDTQTGLIRMGSRYYQPAIGRFVSPDPAPADLSDPQALNRYSYALNDPYAFVDPTGTQAVPLEESALAPPIAEPLEGLTDADWEKWLADYAAKGGLVSDPIIVRPGPIERIEFPESQGEVIEGHPLIDAQGRVSTSFPFSIPVRSLSAVYGIGGNAEDARKIGLTAAIGANAAAQTLGVGEMLSEPVGVGWPKSNQRGTLLLPGRGQGLGKLMGRSKWTPTQGSVDMAKAQQYAAEMRAGRWDWSSPIDKVIIDAEGKIMSGHHRIVAAEIAGVQIPESAIYTYGQISPRVARSWAEVVAK